MADGSPAESSPSRRVCFAHTLPGTTQPEQGWEPLEDHLLRLAGGWAGRHEGAEVFAGAFGAAARGRLAGLWHDLGKYAEAFQDYLIDSARQRAGAIESGVDDGGGPGSPHGMRRVDHSTCGAKLAVEAGPLGWLLAYPIAGHHGGLPDFDQLWQRLKRPGIRAELARIICYH